LNSYSVSITSKDTTKATDTNGASVNKAIQNVQTGRIAVAGSEATATLTLNGDMLKDGNQISIGSSTITIDYASNSVSATKVGVKDYLKDDGTLDTSKLSAIADRITQSAKLGGANTDFTVGNNNGKLTFQSRAASTEDLSTTDKVKAQIKVVEKADTTSALTLQIGDTAKDYNKLQVSVGDMHSNTIGTTDASGKVTASIKDISVADQSSASAAIDVIKDAINQVSSTRGDLGAIQNRLEHTSNNLSVMTENIQDAESTIRDTDIAEEMMSYTKNNILLQSAQAMLAQANQVPQGVLQLLQ
jgi:flagellin